MGGRGREAGGIDGIGGIVSTPSRLRFSIFVPRKLRKHTAYTAYTARTGHTEPAFKAA
jgi:hypothetical protein